MTDDLDLTALDEALTEFIPEGQTQLIPALFKAQEIYGHLPDPVIRKISRALRVPRTRIFGVIEFYSMLHHLPTGRTTVHVCTSPMCAQYGGDEALKMACEHLGVEPGVPARKGAFMVEKVQCLGLCDHAPAALVGDVPVAGIDPSDPKTWIKKPTPAPLGVVDGDPRWLTHRIGQNDPIELKAFEAAKGFVGLKRAIESMTPEKVIDEIKASGLVGRGGAAFPTGLKWQFTAATEGPNRYIVCNADESEPGTFKDRVLMEGDPFSVIEGIILAGYAAQAQKGFIYLRGEYPRAHRIMEEALAKARDAGYLGENILGSDFSFDIEIRSGAGAYICGEETALFESIEGNRGYPRMKPPFPTTHGLYDRPTVINNVETLCTAAWIILNGAERYRSIGTKDSPGSKLFCLSGDVARRGVYEAPFGTRLGELIDMAGGAVGEIQAILLGGAAGSIVGPKQLDLPMSFEGLSEAGLSLGSGVISVLNEERDLIRYVGGLADFFAHESCGKCVPCRIGTAQIRTLMRRIIRGEGVQKDLEKLEELSHLMKRTSLCGLGQSVASPMLSSLKYFRHKYEALLTSGARSDTPA